VNLVYFRAVRRPFRVAEFLRWGRSCRSLRGGLLGYRWEILGSYLKQFSVVYGLRLRLGASYSDSMAFRTTRSRSVMVKGFCSSSALGSFSVGVVWE
jgi:hypothetical protein